jgi:NAD-dependent deacetylase
VINSAFLDPARALLEEARRIVVLTGAGISAESGVPTFRGEDGLWKTHRAEDLATPQAFARDPRLVWEWYQWRRELIARCEPNAGHLALAGFVQRRPETRIVTQNVDGLHEMAARQVAEEAARGSEQVPEVPAPLELHGSLFRSRCITCGHRAAHREAVDATSEETLPRCSECGGLLRPDVVWFGEMLDPDVVNDAGRAAGEADVCLVVGTSSLVYPAAGLPRVTLARGGAVIEVNPDTTPLTPVCALSIRAPAGEALPPLLQGL